MIPPPSSPQQSEQRRHPRAPFETKVRLTAGPGGRSFQAVLPSIDVSLGGIFFQSEFSLRIGSELRVSFELPGDGRPVEAEGVVVRIEQYDARRPGGRNGFAVRFTRFEGDGALILASLFLAPRAREFASRWLRSRSRGEKARASARSRSQSRSQSRSRPRSRPRSDVERLVDALIAWELERGEAAEPVSARR